MAKQETIAEIIAEMRNEGHTGPADALEWVREKMTYYADILEAAHKREVDELKEQIEDLRQQRDLWSKRAAELVEKCNEQYAKLKQSGDCAKLREAVELLLTMPDWCCSNTDDPLECAEYNCVYQSTPHGEAGPDCQWKKIRAALAAPPRNCDMPLVVDGPADNDADKAWLVFKRHNPDAYFDVSGLLRCIDWLLASATEQKGEGDGNK